MASQKKNIEKIHFEYFKERCIELPEGILDDDRENPDFLIKHSKGILGIEHTQLFKIKKHPNAPQALEAFRNQIIESSRNICEKDTPPLYVQVWFNFNQRVPLNRKKEIQRISMSLAEFVKKWHKENPNEFFQEFRNPNEISEVYQMIITHIGDGWAGLPNHRWTVEAPAVVYNFTIEHIQNCITEKNDRYEDYIKSCNNCWLLITFNAFKNSQSFEMPKQINHKFESKFERIFILDTSHRKELKELPILKV